MQDHNEDTFTVTERTGPNEVTTTVVTTDGASSWPCPGGITEDELLD
ncbi:hypothetical protein ACPESV_24545 [Streptomyces umbrinus]